MDKPTNKTIQGVGRQRGFVDDFVTPQVKVLASGAQMNITGNIPNQKSDKIFIAPYVMMRHSRSTVSQQSL